MNKSLYQLSAITLATIFASSAYAADSETDNNSPLSPQVKEHHLTHEQMQARHDKMMEHMFNKADLNKDGVISKEEAMKVAEEHFDKIDTNHDGKITREEQAAYYKKMQEKHHKMRAEHHKHHPNAQSPQVSPDNPPLKSQ